MAVTVRLWSNSDFNMVSSWTDMLLVTKRKDGSISVKAKKRAEDGLWHVERVDRVRSASAFIKAVESCWDALNYSFGYEEVRKVLGPLASLDAELAAATGRATPLL